LRTIPIKSTQHRSPTFPVEHSELLAWIRTA
jgi:hypothetical protein